MDGIESERKKVLNDSVPLFTDRKVLPMKITCEYCGCYVEADENNLCPCCAAPLGDSIRAEEERLKKEAEEQAAKEGAKAAEEAEAAADAAKEQAITGAITGLAASIGTALLNNSAHQTQPGNTPPSGMRPSGPPKDPRRAPIKTQDSPVRHHQKGPHHRGKGPQEHGSGGRRR